MTAIAPDTNLVVAITSRRWLTVLQELRGEALIITPTVRAQVRDRMSDLTDRSMRIRFRRHPPTSARIAQAVRTAAAGYASDMGEVDSVGQSGPLGRSRQRPDAAQPQGSASGSDA